MISPLSRRQLVGGAIRAAGLAVLSLGPDGLLAPIADASDRRSCARHPVRASPGGPPGPHPDPRPGVDASHLPSPESVRAGHPRAADAFEEARTIPEILDGDAPHRRRGCDAQAWGVTEALRVWKLLNGSV